MDFEHKTIFVTGAASGIGKASALAFAAQGARVAVVDRNKEALAEVVNQIEEIRSEALALHCDITQGDEVRAAVEATVSRWGRLDSAVNAAGVEGATKKLLEEDDALFDRTMDVNLRGVWHCMRAQIEQMTKQAEGGTIVNVSSGAGLVGSARSAIYSASKHAVLGLTRSAGLQYARNGVRINAVCPSGVQTPMADRIVDSFEGEGHHPKAAPDTRWDGTAHLKRSPRALCG